MDCLQMATEEGVGDDIVHVHGTTEPVHEASYLFVKVLGKGAFGEAVLYRKTEVNHYERSIFELSFELIAGQYSSNRAIITCICNI